MIISKFDEVIRGQLATCEKLLTSKGQEYAPDAALKHLDRLAHFKKAAEIIGGTQKEALLGMLAKHLVSLSDMITDRGQYSLDRWSEKITDSINYLLILRAIVEEEEGGEENHGSDQGRHFERDGN